MNPKATKAAGTVAAPSTTAVPARPQMLPPTVREVVAAIREDAEKQSQQFLNEVVVPHGGE